MKMQANIPDKKNKLETTSSLGNSMNTVGTKNGVLPKSFLKLTV